jgi:hypothetical protein
MCHKFSNARTHVGHPVPLRRGGPGVLHTAAGVEWILRYQRGVRTGQCEEGSETGGARSLGFRLQGLGFRV